MFAEGLCRDEPTLLLEQSYDPEDVCNDSVFFIPVIDKIFELTRAYENAK